MLLRAILLQLIIGVCLHELIAVRALPTKRADAASEMSKARDKIWWSQLNVPWIDITLGEQKPWESCPGYNQNDEVFKKDLTKEFPLRRENQLSVKGNNNRGIFMLAHNAESSGNEVIVKILNLEPLSASCEVFALKELTQVQQDEHNAKSPWSDQLVLFIKSGFVKDHAGNKWGVIVMRKQPGQQLSQMAEWITGTPEFKRHMVNTVYERTLQKIYDLVEKKGLVHVDFGPTNILVDHDGCYLIDFGAPSVYHIKGTKPTFEEFERWYKIRWGFLWGSVLQEI